jgi:hypothetical protein
MPRGRKVLIYKGLGNGRQLVGVEFVLIADAWWRITPVWPLFPNTNLLEAQKMAKASAKLNIPLAGAVQVTTSATADAGVDKPGEYPLLFNKPTRLLVLPGRKGKITLSAIIDVDVPVGAVFEKRTLPVNQTVPFECNASGDFAVREGQMNEVHAGWDRPFNLSVDVHTWQDNLLDGVKAPPKSGSFTSQ